jgi:hypothetical protein
MRLLRSLILAFILCGFGWFQFGQPLTAGALAHRAEDIFDRRPARTILIVGNSRTYYHDMPDMIRAMADSAHEAQKLEITLDAPAGSSFEILWNDRTTQNLLRQPWNDVVFQGESRGQSSDDLARSFQTFGTKLINEAHPRDGRPRLVVNWPYASSQWDDGDPDGSERVAFAGVIESSTAALGERTGARLIDVARLWLAVEHDYPEIMLTEDGNHPTLAGSYLFALALYGDLSGHDLGAVTYVPQGLDPATVTELRDKARAFQTLG